MKRAIKFRGKQCDNGEWAYGYYARLSNEFKEWHCIMTEKDASENYIKDCNGYNMLYTPINHNTLGQFTGLLDKNGKEIYEGDIVEATSIRYGYKDFMKKMLCEIVYNNDFCCFDFLASDRQRFICTSIADVEIEVIGNIHDNPELMEGGEK